MNKEKAAEMASTCVLKVNRSSVSVLISVKL